jgi:2-hydroxy-3-keto-5-methylthiopentenyl-1-phosphate phosphatase
MMKKLSLPVSILCDFDGTISPVDLSDFLYRRFAACGVFYADQWAQGLISTGEEVVRTFATVSAGSEEIAEALREVPIDVTFQELVQLARENGLDLAVVSDGLDWAIKIVLDAHGIQDLAIYANHVMIQDGKLNFEFPWYDPSCPLAGVCKPLVMKQYRRGGGKIIFIGDGRSDQDAVQKADLVFAKDDLAEYCREKGIPAFEYKNFTEICHQITTWLEKLN